MFKFIRKKVRLLSFNRKGPYLQFYRILGFYPYTLAYYQLAVRHRSMTPHTANGYMLSNERLEFLGDAVLNSVITDILFNRFEKKREGFLTNTRSKIVSRDYLNQLALNIGLDKLVVKSKDVGRGDNNNVYGNAFEALIGAIYLDYGYRQCRTFVMKKLIGKHIDLDKVIVFENNYKSKLIEYCQKHHLSYEYVLLDMQPQDGGRHLFETELLIAGRPICKATGSSKKESQQNVSYNAFQIISSSTDFVQQLLEFSAMEVDN